MAARSKAWKETLLGTRLEGSESAKNVKQTMADGCKLRYLKQGVATFRLDPEELWFASSVWMSAAPSRCLARASEGIAGQNRRAPCLASRGDGGRSDANHLWEGMLPRMLRKQASPVEY